MNSDEDKLYVKTVALDGIYNFVVEKFLNRNCLGSQNIIVSSHILKFGILNWNFAVNFTLRFIHIIKENVWTIAM